MSVGRSVRGTDRSIRRSKGSIRAATIQRRGSDSRADSVGADGGGDRLGDGYWDWDRVGYTDFDGMGNWDGVGTVYVNGNVAGDRDGDGLRDGDGVGAVDVNGNRMGDGNGTGYFNGNGVRDCDWDLDLAVDSDSGDTLRSCLVYACPSETQSSETDAVGVTAGVAASKTVGR